MGLNYGHIPSQYKGKFPEDLYDMYTRENGEMVLFYHGPFSQWWPNDFIVDDIKYNCNEQYMMASKAALFEDQKSFEKIMEVTGPWEKVHDFTKYPKEQKRLGRLVKNFDTDIWNDNAVDIVERGQIHKLLQNTYILEMLGMTKGKLLVEASPYDKIWGIGLRNDDPRAFDMSQWKGLNWLGEALTKARINILGE